MPELPEVETVVRGLDRLIVGKKFSAVEFDWLKSFPNSDNDSEAFLISAMVTKVRRRAKVIMIDLSSLYTLVIHLKMTGQLVFVPKTESRALSIEHRGSSSESMFNAQDSMLSLAFERFGAGHPSDSLVGNLPDNSTRVTLTFDDGSHLFFNDQRKFGWMKLIPTNQVSELPFFQKVGPEPLLPEFTFETLYNRSMRRKNSNIKAVLLDQSVLAGIGNIYADESLWMAKIHPETKVVDIAETDFKNLHTAIIEVLTLSIEKGGSTNKNYVNAEGKKGSYMDFAKVFRRENQQCFRCGEIIIKTRVAGRGTHTCPKCQSVIIS